MRLVRVVRLVCLVRLARRRGSTVPFPRRDESAVSPDHLVLFQKPPGLVRQGSSERLDVIRTARRVRDGIEVRLLREDVRHVGREMRLVAMRFHQQRVGAAHDCSHRLGRRTKQVRPGVEEGGIVAGGARVQPHRLWGDGECLEYVGP